MSFHISFLLNGRWGEAYEPILNSTDRSQCIPELLKVIQHLFCEMEMKHVGRWKLHSVTYANAAYPLSKHLSKRKSVIKSAKLRLEHLGLFPKFCTLKLMGRAMNILTYLTSPFLQLSDSHHGLAFWLCCSFQENI